MDVSADQTMRSSIAIRFSHSRIFFRCIRESGFIHPILNIGILFSPFSFHQCRCSRPNRLSISIQRSSRSRPNIAAFAFQHDWHVAGVDRDVQQRPGERGGGALLGAAERSDGRGGAAPPRRSQPTSKLLRPLEKDRRDRAGPQLHHGGRAADPGQHPPLPSVANERQLANERRLTPEEGYGYGESGSSTSTSTTPPGEGEHSSPHEHGYGESEAGYGESGSSTSTMPPGEGEHSSSHEHEKSSSSEGAHESSCSAGQFAPPGQTNCLPCPVGTYQSQPFSTGCSPCSAGHACPAPGAVSMVE